MGSIDRQLKANKYKRTIRKERAQDAARKELALMLYFDSLNSAVQPRRVKTGNKYIPAGVHKNV